MSCVKKWKLFHLIEQFGVSRDFYGFVEFHDKITHLISSTRLQAITLIWWNTCAIVTYEKCWRTSDTVMINMMLQVSIEHTLIAIHSARKWLTFLLTDVCLHWKMVYGRANGEQHPRHLSFGLCASRCIRTRLSNTWQSITHLLLLNGRC